ncbi:MAG TPA: hypothetical protein VD971_07075 [Phycisphaerales bacterium]|nr:hypothetical protein [Phycisphaerales bacterium]
MRQGFHTTLTLWSLREAVQRAIHTLVVARLPTHRAMPALIRLCEEISPGPWWRDIAAIDWKRGAAHSLRAANRAITPKAVTASIGALWFGTPDVPGHEPVIAVRGLRDFTPNSAAHAYGSRPLPLGKRELSLPAEPIEHLEALVNARLRRSGETFSQEDDAAIYAVAFGYTCFVAAETALAISPKLSRRRTPLGVMAGPASDTGDVLGVIERGAWRPSPQGWYPSLDPECREL